MVKQEEDGDLGDVRRIDTSKLIEENLENIIVHVYTRFGYAEVDCKQFVDPNQIREVEAVDAEQPAGGDDPNLKNESKK